MKEQSGPILLFIGTLFSIAGLIYYIALRRQKSRYRSVTSATIISCREYEETVPDDEHIYVTRKYFAVELEYVINNKHYKARYDISRKGSSYSVGQQLKIYYNPRNPKEIDIAISVFRKASGILSHVFLFAGIASLLIGSYLTFYHD